MACVRCGGSGSLMQYLKVDGGRCFRCGGSGVDPKEIGVFTEKQVHKETVIAGRKVVLTTKKDPDGRFLGYSVFIQGTNQEVTCKNIKEASAAFDNLKKQVLSANTGKAL